MRNSWGVASGCLAVLMTAVVACSGRTTQPLVGDNDGGGGDAPGDAGRAPHADAGLPPDAPGDGGGDPPADAGGTPDAAPPGDLAGMCGSIPVTTEDWEHCRAKRFCETLVHCSEMNLYTDVQECIELDNALSGGQIGFDAFESARSVAAGRASINVDEFTQCLDELSPERCSTAATAPSCAKRYTGTVADRQGCLDDAECMSPGAHCAPAECGASCCMGTCTPLARLGEPCQDFSACEPGLVCSLTSQKCMSGDVGSLCDRYDCDAANWCDHGTCEPYLPEGGACDSLLQCGGETECVGMFRHPAGQPAHCLHVTSPGDACDWSCLGNLRCDLSNPKGLGTCRPLPQIGEACTALLPCTGKNLRCGEQGVCIARTGLDQPCSDGTCLPGLFCTDQLGAANPVCSAPFADGESGCKQDAQCQSHLCTGNQTTPGQCLDVAPTCP